MAHRQHHEHQQPWTVVSMPPCTCASAMPSLSCSCLPIRGIRSAAAGFGFYHSKAEHHQHHQHQQPHAMTFPWLNASIMSISSHGLLFPPLPAHLHLPCLHLHVALCQHYGHEQPQALTSTTQRLSIISIISISSLTL